MANDGSSEFPRPVRIDQIGGDARNIHIAANVGEREALARRFRVRAIGRLDADYILRAVAGGWLAEGSLHGEVVQACVASGQDVPESIIAPFTIRFVRDAQSSEEEIELSEEDCDVITLDEDRIDMGEAVAQSFALALNPYPRAANADAYLRDMGVKQEDEMGALAGLKDLLARKG